MFPVQTNRMVFVRAKRGQDDGAREEASTGKSGEGNAGAHLDTRTTGDEPPRPARHERGEGWGEGSLDSLPTGSDVTRLLSPALSSIPWRRGRPERVAVGWCGCKVAPGTRGREFGLEPRAPGMVSRLQAEGRPTGNEYPAQRLDCSRIPPAKAGTPNAVLGEGERSPTAMGMPAPRTGSQQRAFRRGRRGRRPADQFQKLRLLQHGHTQFLRLRQLAPGVGTAD